MPPLSSMLALLGHEVDDRVRGEHVELGGVGAAGAEDIAGELDHHALQAEAQAQVRDLVLAGVVGGLDLALDAALAEAAGDEDAGHAVESLVQVLLGQRSVWTQWILASSSCARPRG